MRLKDSTTWVTQTIDDPSGGPAITYWICADWQGYNERHTINSSIIKAQFLVPFNRRFAFRNAALGYVKSLNCPVSTPAKLERVTPLAYPFSDNQKYLVDLSKEGEILSGANWDGGNSGRPLGVDALNTGDATVKGWPGFPDETGLPARIKYGAIFATLPYNVLTEAQMTTGSFNEQARNVVRSMSSYTKERIVPNYQLELATTPIQLVPEAGFVPFTEYELKWTWVGVPLEYVPYTAISQAAGCINDAAFGYVEEYPLFPATVPATTYGKYPKGCLLFKGPIGEMVPYRGPNDQLLVDIPYKFTWQPADGGEDGQLKIPLGYSGLWAKVRKRGTVASPVYLKKYYDFSKLFKPQCPAALA